jgi:lipopolysaccharide transport system ATP-binding protein
MSDVAISVQNLSKCYQIYDNPRDRLKQFVMPRLQSATRQTRRKYYREFWALRDVSFDVMKGETLGIIGRNGSGKSTLLQMICGTLSPTDGSVETNGRVAALLELGSGFNPEFTGRENVYLNATVLGLSKQEVDQRFDAIAAFADIGDFIEQPVKTYSSGMFVRLAFAIQANVDPEILIVDEALAVGDAYFVHRCMLRFNELQNAGTTILFVSHDANTIRNLCSRSIWLAEGSIKDQGNSGKVVDGYLANLFGRVAVVASPTVDQTNTHTPPLDKPYLQKETSIPNIDRRLGDQKCSLVGVALYDRSMNRISSARNESKVILRVTIQNNSLDSATPIIVGYIFRNTKGQEIASTNNQIEDQIIGPIPKGNSITVQMEIILPLIYPGSYAFTATVGYTNSMCSEIFLSDRVENAIVFDIWSEKIMHVMLNFPTIFRVEEDSHE